MLIGLIEIGSYVAPLNACLVTIAHKCGKPSCRCNRGNLHKATALKYRINGKQKMKYVRKADVERVKRQLYEVKGIEIIDRYRDPYIFTLAKLHPELSGTDIMVKAYEVFGRKKLNPASLTAN